MVWFRVRIRVELMLLTLKFMTIRVTFLYMQQDGCLLVCPQHKLTVCKVLSLSPNVLITDTLNVVNVNKCVSHT